MEFILTLSLARRGPLVDLYRMYDSAACGSNTAQALSYGTEESTSVLECARRTKNISTEINKILSESDNVVQVYCRYEARPVELSKHRLRSPRFIQLNRCKAIGLKKTTTRVSWRIHVGGES